MTNNENIVKYKASATLRRFHKSNAFVRLVMGPIGSGKSSGMCWELLHRAQAQIAQNGIRKSRWCIIRNTYKELTDTTLNTFMGWFGAAATLNKNEMIATVRMNDVEAEFLFRALDKPADVKKLLSLELTGAWINEGREIPKAILDALTGRVGRYPAVKDGGCTWSGIIIDTNGFDVDHWMYKLFVEQRPEGYEFYQQPSGISEKAENLDNLPSQYYQRIIVGKSKDWIKLYVENEFGYVQDGRPVYPEFSQIHTTDEPVIVPESANIIIGVDFGLTPAALFGFKNTIGRWFVFDELVSYDMGAKRFGTLLKARINEIYSNNQIKIFGDPAGKQRAQTDETTVFEIFQSLGLNIFAAPTNNFKMRREAVADNMNRLIDGQPALLVGPGCPRYKKALQGGYCYKRIQVSGDDRFHDEPDKNEFSHIADAGQYMHLGGGDMRNLLNRQEVGDNDYHREAVSGW